MMDMMDENGQGSGAMVATQLSAMMFLEFFLWGAWYVTMGPFMDAAGMDDSWIGWAYTVGPIAAIVSPFFLGMVADRFFATERVLGVMHLLGGALLCLAPAAAERSPVLFLVVILLHMLCFMPTLGLTSSLALHNMTRPEAQFPLIRVFGTIGWIVAGLAISALAYDKSPNMFYVAGGSGLVLGVFSFLLPHTPAPARGRAFSARDALGLDSLVLLKDRSFAVFAVCAFLISIPLSAYYAYAGIFVGQMGFEGIGGTMSFGQMSEILLMLVMPLCFARLGVKWMLAVGMAAWAVRYGLFSGAADEQVKWMVLGGIVLHGVCYDFFFVTGQIYVDRKAGARVRGQAQGFFVLITQGLGMLIGAQVMARLVKNYTSDPGGVVDWKAVWMYPAVFAGVVLVAFVLLFKDRAADSESPEPAPAPPGAPSRPVAS